MSTIKTTLPRPNETSHRQDGTINKGLKVGTWNEVLAELKQACTDLNSRMDELSAANTLNAQLNGQIAAKDTLIGNLNGRCQDHQKTIGEHETTIQTQQADITRFTKVVEELKLALEDARNALKDAGRHSAMEQDEGVKKALANHVKDFTFRTVKFARGDKLDRVTKDIYVAIGPLMGTSDENNKDMYVSEDEFCRICTSRVTYELNRRRQYVQTQLLAAFISKSNPGVTGYLALPDR